MRVPIILRFANKNTQLKNGEFLKRSIVKDLLLRNYDLVSWILQETFEQFLQTNN